MANDDFQREWQAYQHAVRELYNPPSQAMFQAERGAEEGFAESLEAHGEQVVAHAEAVRQTLIPALGSPDSGQRELAGLKLLAAAAYDLSAANTILAIDGAGPEALIDRDSSTTVLASEEFRQILDAPLDRGMHGLIRVERTVLPQDPAAAREALRNAITDFLKEIPTEASSLSQKAVAAVVGLGLAPAQQYFPLAAKEILALVPESVSGAVGKAAKLAMEGFKKLRVALGEDQEQDIRKKAADWLKDIQDDRDGVTKLLDGLYEMERIGQESLDTVANSPQDAPAGAFNDVTRALEELSARYSKTKGLLDKFMVVLALGKPVLMGAVPWGPVALYATYGGLLGYAVCSGGDYLDWYRTGEIHWLDRIEGLRFQVRRLTQAQASTVDDGDAGPQGH